MAWTFRFGFSLTISCLMMWTSVSGFGCISDNGDVVEWFVVYKLKTGTPMSGKSKSKGLDTLYMDSTMKQMKKSPQLISESGHPLSKTILQLTGETVESNPSDYLQLMYSTRHPGSNADVPKSWAHANGVVGFNETAGFWLSHSLPRYPNIMNLDNLMPKSGQTNAQTFLCISLDRRYLTDVAKQLRHFCPSPFKSIVSERFNEAKILNVLSQTGPCRGVPANILQSTLASKRGTRFFAYAKSKNFKIDVYKDFLSDELKDQLFVQTWPRVSSANKLPSNCTGYHLYNVKAVKFEVDGTRYFIDSMSDHSKWAVSESKKFFCVGNLNRHLSQKERGGGVICMQHREVANAFRNAVGRFYESCPVSKQTMAPPALPAMPAKVPKLDGEPGGRVYN